MTPLPDVVTRRYIYNVLRHFDPADEDELVRVWLDSTIPGQDFLSEEYWRSQEPLVRDHFIPIADTWIVEQDGEIVAFMSILEHTIGGLFTHPDHQGKGYGRVLVEHARTLHEIVRVEVFRANVRAMAFYESCGFVEESSKLDEATGLEAVIMRVDGLRQS